MTDKLWCLHIAAPDNIYAAPSQQEAEKVAERHNREVTAYYAHLKEKFTQDEMELFPTLEGMKANVVEWPYGKDFHADDCKNWEKILKSGLEL